MIMFHLVTVRRLDGGCLLLIDFSSLVQRYVPIISGSREAETGGLQVQDHSTQFTYISKTLKKQKDLAYSSVQRPWIKSPVLEDGGGFKHIKT